ncbi:MFS transporter [Fodinicola acaciae]|uniref:MFS transporter n=1 Tax=Fodinicola acaciae TaxID=2681555 RepID=UPI0013CFA91F|nr:MFS transporter [Fodinicola acaciae]
MKRSAALIVTSVALAADMLIYGVAIPVLPRIASSAGADASAVSVLFACYAVAMLVATPFAGWLVDRIGHRLPMIAGLFALAASTVLFATLQAFPVLMAARVLQGVAAAFAWTAGLALIAAVFPAEERGKPLGIALSASGVGVLLGPAVGGFLADTWGTHAPFVLAAVVALLDGVARLVLVRDGDHAPAERPGRVWRHPSTALMFALTALGAGLIAFLEPILPLHAAAAFSADSNTIGLIFAGAVLAGAVSSSIGGFLADKLPRRLLAGAGAFVAAAGLVITGYAGTLWLVAVGLALVTVGAQLGLVTTIALISAIADDQSPPAYGAAYALYSIAYTTGMMVAPLLAAAGSAFLNFAWLTIAAAVLAAVIALVTTLTRTRTAVRV